jgi:hypothetical protein
MPNVPGMSRFWDTRYAITLLNPAGFVQACPEDPSRWFLAISVPGAAAFVIAPGMPATLDEGFFISAGTVELTYSQWGPLVGQRWSIFGLGAVTNFTTYTASIRLR